MSQEKELTAIFKTHHRDEHRFDRGAWLTVLLVAALLICSAAIPGYFFTLPTDGWFTPGNPDAPGAPGYIYTQDMLPTQSGLQPGDHVIAVQGVSLEKGDLSPLKNFWRAGSTLTYTVVRAGIRQDVQVQMVHWQPLPALRAFILESGGIAGLLGQLAFFVIAMLTFYKRPEDHAVRTLLLIATAIILTGGPLMLLSNSLSAKTDPVLSMVAMVAIGSMYTILFPPLLLRLALVFPHPKPGLLAHPRLEYLPFVIGFLIILVLAVFKINPALLYAWTIASAFGSIAILLHSAFTLRDALSRAQMRWGLWGLLVGLLMSLASFLATFGLLTGFWAQVANTISALSFGVIGLTLSIAILRYRLFDIDVIIRRTLSYSLLTAILVLFYFGSVVVFQQVFRLLTGSGSNAAILLSTLAIAALFNPLRRRLQSLIDRRFFRSKYDAQQTLAAFGLSVRSVVELPKLSDELLSRVEETMQPEQASLWLKRSGEQSLVNDWGKSK